jgi:EAL domain-containing protein (putative c-di-GMP-specific phosphodiesterase class I)
MITQSIDSHSVNRITLEGVFRMIDYLDVNVVFEGIETEAELN